MEDDQRFEARAAARSFLEILGLTGLAVAQPLLDVFGRAPEAFIARDAGTADIVAFAFVVTLVPAALCWLGVTVVRAVSPAAGRVAQLAVVGVLVALFAVQLL